MSKLKIIKKVLVALILFTIVVFADIAFDKYVEAATTNNNPLIYWNRST